ncbi:hypothetical protein MNBD_GAMMA18-2250 [hydrothermal vent metagenome]|uniref:Putative regulatory protein FmdB zinc ribbon domain-containing protein n=1 Tax=hydrothermal vent metagenome TaxID=652676 RepID=A0A3B0Z487_9ZZZZ
MPFYEYRCQSCGHQVEVLQKLNDMPLEECSGCGGLKMKKLISASANVSSRKEAVACSASNSGGIPPCMSGGGCPSS